MYRHLLYYHVDCQFGFGLGSMSFYYVQFWRVCFFNHLNQVNDIVNVALRYRRLALSEHLSECRGWCEPPVYCPYISPSHRKSFCYALVAGLRRVSGITESNRCCPTAAYVHGSVKRRVYIRFEHVVRLCRLRRSLLWVFSLAHWRRFLSWWPVTQLSPILYSFTRLLTLKERVWAGLARQSQ